MLTSPGFGSLLCIVSELRLFCAHELCVSCPRVFPEEDKVKSGVAHILRIPPSRTARESGAPFTWKSHARDQYGKDRATPPPCCSTMECHDPSTCLARSEDHTSELQSH